jgi:hypothetical protein
MKKFLEDNKMIIIIVLGILLWFNSCSNNRNVESKLKHANIEAIARDSVYNNIIKELKILEIQNQIEHLKTARRIVYDNNSIVRTTTRPDDVINNYNTEIEKLREQLK